MAKSQPSKNPSKIPPKRRLRFLQQHSRVGRYNRNLDLIARRQRFDHYKKVNLLPADRHDCYVCSKQAEHWHHIVHIKNGGEDCKRNLVPLCLPCHKKAHRHDVVRGNRRRRPHKYVTPFRKPVLLMEVVYPLAEKPDVKS